MEDGAYVAGIALSGTVKPRPVVTCPSAGVRGARMRNHKLTRRVTRSCAAAAAPDGVGHTTAALAECGSYSRSSKN